MALRTFIAIELPADIRVAVYQTSLALRAGMPTNAVRWVKPESIHLTLRFLGDTKAVLVPKIGQAIERTVESLPMFNLELDKLGCFPNPRNPRIIWVGIGGQIDRLHHLQGSIEQTVTEFGWEPDKRRFHPHLTSGRVKDRQSVIQANLPYGRKVESQQFSVRSVSLIESLLSPAGAVYSQRYHCQLKEIL